MVDILPLLIIGFFFAVAVSVMVFMFMFLSWNIPVSVLRFTGNKQRPSLIHRKARKKMIKGVPYLWVKGYNRPIRDFKAEHYYPSPKSKWGGLIVWEFEDGWLTPSPPKGIKLSKAQQAVVATAIDTLNDIRPVAFEHDEEMHQRLKLKIVDDVDAEFAVEQLFRQDGQYSTGFFECLSKNSASIMAIMVVAFVLVGFIVWLDKSPEYMAQCANVARSTILDAIKQEGAAAIIPPG